jgi:transcriptional regulator with XRE-family HTH domain
MTIGERIKMRRKELGLTADQVAERVGVNRATIYRYESDEIKSMGTETLVPLAAALRTTPAWLLQGEDPDDDPQQHAFDDDPEKRTLYEMIDKSSVGQKRAAIMFFKQMLGEEMDE